MILLDGRSNAPHVTLCAIYIVMRRIAPTSAFGFLLKHYSFKPDMTTPETK